MLIHIMMHTQIVYARKVRAQLEENINEPLGSIYAIPVM